MTTLPFDQTWMGLDELRRPGMSPEFGPEWLEFLQEVRPHVSPAALPPVEVLSYRADGEHGVVVFVEESDLKLNLPAGVWRASRALEYPVSGFHARIPLAHSLAFGVTGMIPQTRRRMLDRLAQVFEGHAAERHADYVQVSRVPIGSLEDHVLRARGYVAYPNEYDHVLIVPESDYEAYLMTRSTNFRHNVRRARRKLEQQAGRIAIMQPATMVVDDVYRLFFDLCNHKNIEPYYHREYFAQAAQRPEFGVVGIFLRDRMIACATWWATRDHISFKHAGLDYRHLHEVDSYTNLLQGVVQAAMATGTRVAHLGLTNSLQKQRLGARPVVTQRRILPLTQALGSVLPPHY